MIEKVTGIWEALGTSALFALVGMTIGVGRLLNSGETLSARLLIGRALSTGGIARADPKLRALVTMTPAALKSWVAANVTNLAQARDAIATLAIAIGILARRI